MCSQASVSLRFEAATSAFGDMGNGLASGGDEKGDEALGPCPSIVLFGGNMLIVMDEAET